MGDLLGCFVRGMLGGFVGGFVGGLVGGLVGGFVGGAVDPPLIGASVGICVIPSQQSRYHPSGVGQQSGPLKCSQAGCALHFGSNGGRELGAFVGGGALVGGFVGGVVGGFVGRLVGSSAVGGGMPGRM